MNNQEIYDDPIVYPFTQFWERQGAMSYDTPQSLNPIWTYIAQVSTSGTLIKVRVGKLREKCPMKFPLIEEGGTRHFYYSKQSLIVCDIDIEVFHRQIVKHSTHCAFKELNRVYDLKITPSSYREVVFVQWQNNDHHWTLKSGFGFNYVDMGTSTKTSRGK